MHRALVMLASLASPLAYAGPAKPAAPPKADEARCKNLIDDGRNLAARNKIAEAIAKFEACVAIIPDDPTALGELGFTAYRAKDLAKAEAATRKAVASQAAPNLRGAILYNLGLILQDKKDTAGAIAAYSDSLRSRPNGVVRAKLRDLDSRAAEPFDPYTPHAFAGPFSSVGAFCKTLPAKNKDVFDGLDMPCACGKRIKSAKASAPYKHAEAFLRTCAIDGHDSGSFGEDEYRIAVELDAGWYIAPLTEFAFNRRCSSNIEVPLFLVKDLIPGGAPELQIEFTNEGECRAVDAWQDRSLVVGGIGPSGTPSATPPIMLRRHEEVFTRDKDGSITGDMATAIDVTLKAERNADGTLEVKGKTTGLDDATAGDLLGHHGLSFP